MTNYKFGDIVLVPFPFTDQSTGKKRPAVVISSDRYHRQRTDLILMAVSSQLSAKVAGDVSIAKWTEAGLIKASVFKPILTTVERKLIIRTLGQLQDEDVKRLKEALDEILG
ncbi:MAG: type II toxin-antitoxin system PemK/MazF family toxin [Deinococcota bacterium]|jgi:mRNA interferase MazF|nr:type II toxin-antitoxin system PemK/MazF family toxin [Deinococcota bacterium]